MQIMSVSAFLAYVNDTFKAIWDPTMVAIEGEVSGYRVSQGQWVNFDLKDEESVVSVFMVLRNLTVPVQDGMRVRLYGFPRIYPKYGKFSFSADRVELVGEGALRKALAMLKEKLTSEGLFEASRKRELPRFPSRIALVASRESAAYGDFIRILSERWGGLEIDLYHVIVQGEKAAGTIVSAIQRANASGTSYDALVLTRGGGSFEELMAFNEESVVRALYASKIPTLVGIGHERDVSLAEEVADVRGSTPTDCARRLVPDKAEILYEVASMHGGIAETLDQRLLNISRLIADSLSSADRWLSSVKLRCEQATERASLAGDRWFVRLNDRVASMDRLLHSLDPASVVKRGYAIVRTMGGKVLTSVQTVKNGERITIELREGSTGAIIEQIIQPPLF